MKDNYIKAFSAKVVGITENGVILDRTAFNPIKGGVNCDTGKLLINGKEYEVNEVLWKDGEAVHIIGEHEAKVGDEVSGQIDWERRYKLMKSHTAAHLLSAILFKETGALIGSGNVDVNKSRLGFTLAEMDKALIEKAVEKANELIEKGAPVKISFMPREEALRDPDIVKLAERMPPSVKELRIVEIEGIDRQACGGPHVANIKEIGEIKILKIENKGKGNRRLYYSTN